MRPVSLLIATTALGAALVVAATGSGGQRRRQEPVHAVQPDAHGQDARLQHRSADKVERALYGGAGHFQYEGDLFIYGYDNISTPDTNITSWTVGNPSLKLGLLNNVDFEVNISFYNSIRSATVSTGAYAISQGFGEPSRASNGTCSATKAADRLSR